MAYSVGERLLELLRNFDEAFLDHLGYVGYAHSDASRSLDFEELD